MGSEVSSYLVFALVVLIPHCLPSCRCPVCRDLLDGISQVRVAYESHACQPVPDHTLWQDHRQRVVLDVIADFAESRLMVVKLLFPDIHIIEQGPLILCFFRVCQVPQALESIRPALRLGVLAQQVPRAQAIVLIRQ